jgi:hypothetical protein
MGRPCRQRLLWQQRKPEMESTIAHNLLDFLIHNVLVSTVKEAVREYDEEEQYPGSFASELLVGAVAGVSKCDQVPLILAHLVAWSACPHAGFRVLFGIRIINA